MRKSLGLVLYVIIAVWLQRLFPGWCVDLILPAIVVLLEVKEYCLIVPLFLIWVVIQEGSGFLTFGSSILMFVCVLISFYFLKKYFSFTNLLFVIAFSFINVCFQTLLIILFSHIQNLDINICFLLSRQLKYFFVFGILLYLDLYALRCMLRLKVSNNV